ncbi:MAG TPA: DNA recombination protein RmuC [Ignavibacteria bacterium]|nr:DNA recombination protein RmuC [Ignavibacteria bacterium]HRJ02776.1 DNA recombination protein RmuC [Ignavibacteria bacterium]
MEIILLITGLIVGSLLGFFIAKSKQSALASKVEEKEKALTEKEKLVSDAKSETELERGKAVALGIELSAAKTNIDNLEKRLTEQKGELEELQARFTKEFENLAGRILEDKSRKFTEQNKENLDTILNPLKERIADFEKKVNDVYITETKERAALAEQLRYLHELNKQMSEEANNLTKALKGDTKTQGNWGEYILESILEKSGLVKGREFVIQETIKSDDGMNLRPDVIVNLPDNKSMIIDSKVSLTAYESYCSSDEKPVKEKALAEHINSIRKHIKGLSPKEYQNLYGLQSLDFVLMFIPIEPAFALAVQNDAALFYDAFGKNIIIVSPSTLLATLRTISSIWKQEKQNRNALEIAKKGGELYDKLSAFVDDLIEVGTRMKRANESYESAMKKLSEGRGNIIGRAENLKLMGAKASKSIDPRIVERSIDDSETDEQHELKLIP